MQEVKFEDLIKDEKVLNQLKESKSEEEFLSIFEAHIGKKLVTGGIEELSDEELDAVAGGGSIEEFTYFGYKCEPYKTHGMRCCKKVLSKKICQTFWL